MKILTSLAIGAGMLLVGAVSAGAVVAPPAPQSHAAGVILAREGCGPGWHRNYHGRCVPNEDEGWRRHRRYDDCGRYHHRDRWGHCVRNW